MTPPAQGYARVLTGLRAFLSAVKTLRRRANDGNRRMDDLSQGQETSAAIPINISDFRGWAELVLINCQMYEYAP